MPLVPTPTGVVSTATALTQGSASPAPGSAQLAAQGSGSALYYPQPLFSSRITSLTWPMNSGSGVITRGFMVWATAQTYYGGQRASVNFLYNPTTVMHTNGLEMADVTTATVYRQPGDIATPLAPMNQVVSFSLLFDRTFELWGSYGNNGNALNSGGEGAGSTLNDPTVMGVGADVLAFKQITGEAAMAQQAQAASKNLSAPAAVMQGPMLLIPTWAFFGSISGGLYYYGFISEWDVTYTHFTQFMVPMRCAIDVSFNLLPLPSGAAGSAQQAVVANAPWTTAQLGATGTGNAAGLATHYGQQSDGGVMIVPGSRYTDNPLAVVRVKGVTRQVINSPAAVPVLLTYWWYQMTIADTLQTLAHSLFGDPAKWWMIADANPQILDWSDVPPATLVRIPVIA